jgi:SPP1 family predicted phage head-tail adaptor
VRIGRLRHRITIQQPTVTRNDRGAEVLAWATLATVWAEVRSISGREQVINNNQEIAATSHQVIIRHRADVTPKMRIQWEGRTFGIESLVDSDNRQRSLTLACQELVGDGGII